MKKINDNKFAINIVVAILSGVMFLSSIIAPVVKTKSIEANASDREMFVIIENHCDYKIVYDKETMVEYAMSNITNYGTSYAITMLVNADGTPKLYKGE